MPSRYCPRCNAAHDGQCPLAKPIYRKQVDDRRGTRQQRGYDADWYRLRHQHLLRWPLCADCLDRRMYTAATEVHHMAKVADHPERRLDPDNLMSLCRTCHSRRTARGE